MPDLQDPMRIGELAVMPALHLKDRDLATRPLAVMPVWTMHEGGLAGLPHLRDPPAVMMPSEARPVKLDPAIDAYICI